MIVLNINLSRIPEDRIIKGKKGDYADLILVEKPDDYGNDGFIAMSVSKEERERQVRGEIVGSFKHVGGNRQTGNAPSRPRPEQRRAAPGRRDPDLDGDTN